jgi:1-acyl-sn-glycerol-3-phosphate acyltransferase
MGAVGKFIYYRVLGWKLEGNKNFSKDTCKKAVIIAAPHTSWHDFYIGVLLRNVTGLKANFIGKKELFKWPFGFFFRALGGRPVDRGSKANSVDQITALFEAEEEFRLTLAPEGTRKKVSEWRTGFYYIALKTKVPIIMFTLDFENKRNVVSEPFYPTGDKEKDFQTLQAFFKNVKGKVPEYS